MQVSGEGEGEFGWDAEVGMGPEAVCALLHGLHQLGQGLVRLLADLLVLLYLLLLLPPPPQVLRPLLHHVTPRSDRLVRPQRLHRWDLDDVVLQVDGRLGRDLLVLPDQLLAPLLFLLLGLLAGQGVLAGVGEFVQVELLADDLPPEGEVVPVPELAVDELQLLRVGLAHLVAAGALVVQFLEEVFLDLRCDPVGIGQQVQVVLEQLLLFLGLLLQQPQLLAGQDHILRQVLPVSLPQRDLLLGVLGAPLELALGVAFEVFQPLLGGLEHADGQVAMADEHVVQFCLLCLYQLQVGLFGWVLADIVQLSPFALFLLVPQILDGVQPFQPFLLRLPLAFDEHELVGIGGARRVLDGLSFRQLWL